MTQIFDQNNKLYGDCVVNMPVNNTTPTYLSSIQSKSSAYNIVIDDCGTTLTNTATLTMTLPLSSTVPNGFWFQFYSDITAQAINLLTFAVSGSDTIDAVDTSMVFAAGGLSGIFVSDGVSKWYVLACSARDTGTGQFIPTGDLGVSNRVYGPINLIPSASATFTPTLSTAYFQPFFFPRSVTLTTFSFEVTTLGASNTMRCGLYAPGTKYTTNNGLGTYPNTLLLDCGTVSSASTGVKTISCAASVQGVIYAVIASQGGTSAVLRGSTSFYHPFLPRSGTVTSATIYSGWTLAAAGAFTNNITATIDSSATPPAIILY